MKRALTLFPALVALAVTASAARVGIMTDTHVGFEGKKSAERLERCLRLFRQQRVDMIFHLGDIAENFDPAYYREYAAVRAKVYPEGCPPEKFVFSTHDRIKYVQKEKDPSYADSYAEVRDLLGIAHDRFHRFELEGFTFLLYPQARPHERVAAEVAAECAAHPGRPLFVLDHVPPYDTVSGSEIGGKPVLHGIFRKHPEVIVLTGHVHGSLAHEGKIWQGEYTVLNFGAQKGEPVPDAPRMAAVMDLSPTGAVIRRYDTATGREWHASEPWTLTFPFDPKTAPYRPDVRAERVPAPAFAPDAKLTLTREGEPLSAVGLSFPAAVTPDVATYVVSVKALRGTNWAVRSERRWNADFATEAAKRRTEFKLELSSGYFDSGETVRIAVAPLDFYGRTGPTIEAELAVGEVESWQVVCDAVPEPAKKGEWRAFEGDRTSFEVEAARYLSLSGKARCRLVMEVAFELPAKRCGRFSGLLGPDASSAWQRFYTPRGKSSRRYVIPMNPVPPGAKTLTLALENAKKGRIRIDSFRIERKAETPDRLAWLNRGQVHRGGGRDTRPDNALETFLWCWGHGVAPEADARLTRDGVVIALHDGTLKRVGRGISEELARTPIKELDWNAIRDVDVGSYLAPEYASTRISTFEAICASMAKRPERLLFVDEKGATPRQVAEIARKFGVERQVIYTSRHFELMADWQREVPGGLGMVWLGTGAKDNSPASVAKADAFLEETFRQMAASNWFGISQVQFHVRTDFSLKDPFCPSTDAMKRGISLLHSKGITVQALSWTEGTNPELYRRLWELGFDNLCTDDPLVLFDFLNELRGQHQVAH